MRRVAFPLGAVLLVALAGAARADLDELARTYRESKDDEQRRRVLEALGDLRSAEAEKLLAEALAQDPNEIARLEAVRSLLKHGTESSARALLQAVNAYDPWVTEAVIAGLSKGLPKPLEKWLVEKGLSSERAEVRGASIRIVAARGLADGPSRLRSLANDSSIEVRTSVALAAPLVEAKTAVAVLERLARDKQVRVRVTALASLAPLEGEKVDKVLIGAAETEPAWQARQEAVRALGERAASRFQDVLLRVLKDPKADERVRLAALDAVAPLRNVAVVDVLMALASDGVDRFSAEVRRLLAKLTHEDLGTADEWRSFWKDRKASFRFPAGEPPAPDPARARTTARFFDLPVESLRPCFVIDISGSMSEPMPGGTATGGKDAPRALTTKLAVARAELKRALEALPRNAAFGLILFHERTVPIHETPAPAKPEVIAAALAQTREYEPVGATNVFGALSNVLHASGVRDPEAANAVAFDTIYLLTDGLPTAGAVTNPDELRARVRAWNRFARVRVHTIGIGDQNKEFLEGLARDSGGRYVRR